MTLPQFALLFYITSHWLHTQMMSQNSHHQREATMFYHFQREATMVYHPWFITLYNAPPETEKCQNININMQNSPFFYKLGDMNLC